MSCHTKYKVRYCTKHLFAFSRSSCSKCSSVSLLRTNNASDIDPPLMNALNFLYEENFAKLLWMYKIQNTNAIQKVVQITNTTKVLKTHCKILNMYLKYYLKFMYFKIIPFTDGVATKQTCDRTFLHHVLWHSLANLCTKNYEKFDCNCKCYSEKIKRTQKPFMWPKRYCCHGGSNVVTTHLPAGW